ncbi:MAG: hexameric tyrosine-coordinated heme protein [Alphaproteobacteria bacterium]|nr:hexameric tyrosine-coordinated heme protein [Alphaproteobacteria bacterium]
MDNRLPSLIIPMPTEGYDLAVKPARIAVRKTQSEAVVRSRLRKEYEADADALIAVSQVVATHFATIAAANDYWRVVA